VTDGVTEVAVVAVCNWYLMLRFESTEAGACVDCGTLIAGVQDGPAGHWGGRALRLFDVRLIQESARGGRIAALVLLVDGDGNVVDQARVPALMSREVVGQCVAVGAGHRLCGLFHGVSLQEGLVPPWHERGRPSMAHLQRPMPIPRNQPMFADLQTRAGRVGTQALAA
jgi:hypothetical protein